MSALLLDFDLNDITNFADFAILSNNFGTDLNSPGSSVPEPVSVLLMIGTSAVVVGRGRLGMTVLNID